MANLSITIRNSLNLLGMGPASNWNAYNWNAFKWGEGSVDISQKILHVVGSSLTIDSNPAKAIRHLISESVTIDSVTAKKPQILIATEAVITIEANTSSENLLDGSGYAYVFPDRTIEAEDRAASTFTSGTTPTNSWNAASAPSGGWS